jgi:hypothetical protein
MSGRRALSQTAPLRLRCFSTPLTTEQQHSLCETTLLTVSLCICAQFFWATACCFIATVWCLNVTVARADTMLCVQMISQLALRLRDLHELGYVHRDLKPANVMWLPRQNRWTVIDFGCAARTGEEARLGFSFSYAAPEVISAYRIGVVTMVARVRILNDSYSTA